jgi:hypothetical protein
LETLDLNLVQGAPDGTPIAPEDLTPEMSDWWSGPNATMDAATGLVTNLRAAGANDALVAIMVWCIGISMVLGVLRRSINQVVLTGSSIVDREHSLSIERRKKSEQIGPYYIPPSPSEAGVRPAEPKLPTGYEES